MIIYCGILLGNKKQVLLYINEDVVTEAKEIGLNLSKTCENALKQAIKRLKRSDYSENSNRSSSHISSVKEVVVGVRRFELPTFGYHRSRTSSSHIVVSLPEVCLRGLWSPISYRARSHPQSCKGLIRSYIEFLLSKNIMKD